MVLNVPLKCPHCLNDETFRIDSFSHCSGFDPLPTFNIRFGQQVPPSARGVTIRSYGVAFCPRPKCKAPVLIWLEIPNALCVASPQNNNIPVFHFSGPSPKVLGTWPNFPETDDSEHWPENLREIFREVQEDMRAQRNSARIVSACRSILEVALNRLGYPKNSGTLQKRINSAQADGHITKGMAEWAEKIKIDGNEAIHELTADRTDADALVNFIRTFLEIAFDLPERIKALGGPDPEESSPAQLEVI